jgi:hypothetical protein
VGQFSGADPDELERIGGQFGQLAAQLDGTVGQVTHLIDGAYWLGASGDHFRGDWHSSLAARLHAAAAGLRGAAETLTRNAGEQRIASGSSGTSTPGAPLWSAVRGPLSMTYHVGEKVIGLPGTFDAWAKSFPRLRDSAHFTALHSETTARLGRFSGIADGLAWLGAGVDTVQAAQDVRRGDYVGAAQHGLAATGDVLKTNDVTYPFGVLASLSSHIVEDAQQVDWAHLPSAGDWIQYGPEAVRDAILPALGQTLDSIF